MTQQRFKNGDVLVPIWDNIEDIPAGLEEVTIIKMHGNTSASVRLNTGKIVNQFQLKGNVLVKYRIKDQ